MGANAVTTVPVYVAGEVLTAADLNITNSGIPVFASSVERDAAFGGTGEKTLAEGQYAYLEDTNATQFYDGATWQPVGVAPGLVLVKTQTIGSAVATVTVSDAFSATYDAYKIIVSGGVGSASNNDFQMTLGASATGYYWSLIYTSYNSTVAGGGSSNSTNWAGFGSIDTSSLSLNIDLINPFAAKTTTFTSSQNRSTIAGTVAGNHQVSTSYTAFTLTAASGTMTGGTVRVYGYANS
jgi:hypothetical protein